MSQATTTSHPEPDSDTSVTSNICPKMYVWNHFTKLPDSDINKCNVFLSDGSQCGRELTHDKKGSTNPMKTHLESQHHICDANIPNQTNIISAFKKVKTTHPVSLVLSLSCIFDQK